MDFAMANTMQPPTGDRLKEIIQGPSDVEWRYEMRRDCQEIISGLLLGPFLVSKNLERLKQLGVTHIVCIRDATEAFSVKPRFPDQFIYLTLDVKDTEDQNLITLFPKARDFIYQAINQGGQVLVHCNGGISLSPAFVVMFVMEHFQLSCEDALHLVQNRRYCISPNGGFLVQIKEYEAIYRAALVVAHAPTANQRANRRKREEDDEDEDFNRKRVQHEEAPPISYGYHDSMMS
ncbi:phosphatases II [Serendipita vermifera]|nr:phosphatases II [Serendipita vermifera]